MTLIFTAVSVPTTVLLQAAVLPDFLKAEREGESNIYYVELF